MNKVVAKSSAHKPWDKAVLTVCVRGTDCVLSQGSDSYLSGICRGSWSFLLEGYFEGHGAHL